MVSLGSADPFADLLLSAPIVLELLLIGRVSESVRGGGGGPRPERQHEEELVEDEEVVSGMASSEKCNKVANAEKNDEQGLASN